MAQPKPDTRTQRQKFIDMARKVGASEDEVAFERALKKVAKAAPQKAKKMANKRKR